MRNQIKKLRDQYDDKYRKLLAERIDIRNLVRDCLAKTKTHKTLLMEYGYASDLDFDRELTDILDNKGYDEIEFSPINLKNRDLQIVFLYISYNKLLLTIRDKELSERGIDWDKHEAYIKHSLSRLIKTLNNPNYVLVGKNKRKRPIDITAICLHATRLSVINGLAFSLSYLKWVQDNLHHTNSTSIKGKKRRARDYHAVYRILLLKSREYSLADCSQDVWNDRVDKWKIASYLHKKYIQLLD